MPKTRMVLLLLLVCTGCNQQGADRAAEAKGDTAGLTEHLALGYGRNVQRWLGRLTMLPPEKSAIRKGQSASVYQHPDGSLGALLLSEARDPIGFLTVRADAMVAVGLDSDRDREVDLLVSVNLKDRATRYLMDADGARLLRDWQASRSAFCVSPTDSAQVTRAPATLPLCPRGGPAGSSSAGRGRPLDPMDLICADFDLRPVPSPPVEGGEKPAEPEPPQPPKPDPPPPEPEPSEPADPEGGGVVEVDVTAWWKEAERRIHESIHEGRPGNIEDLGPLPGFTPPPAPAPTGPPMVPPDGPVNSDPGPEGGLSSLLLQYCRERQAGRDTIADQMRRALDDHCFDPVAQGTEVCFGAALDQIDVMGAVRDGRCRDGDARRHCEPESIRDRFGNVRRMQSLGLLELTDRCDPLVCRRPEP